MMTPLRALTVFSSEPIIVYAPTISLVSGFWMRRSSWQSNRTCTPSFSRCASSSRNDSMPKPSTEDSLQEPS